MQIRTMLAAACLAMSVTSGCTTPPPGVQSADAGPAPFAYDSDSLAIKTMFNNQQAAAVAAPFVGVHAKSGVQSGLFPVKATGVSTEPMRLAAEKFLASLDPQQVLRTQFGINDTEWRRWFNIDNGLFVRQGVSLKEMSPKQREAAFALMHASLSARGFAMTEAIRKTDQTLREINTSVSQIEGMTQQNAAMVEETTASIHQLAQEAGEMDGRIGHFQLAEQAAQEWRRAG